MYTIIYSNISQTYYTVYNIIKGVFKITGNTINTFMTPKKCPFYDFCTFNIFTVILIDLKPFKILKISIFPQLQISTVIRVNFGFKF